jgi:hypothetical protein
MARAISEKTRIIRQALKENPSTGNTELAKQLNDRFPGYDFKHSDVAGQKQVMKKLADRPTAEQHHEEDETDTVRARRRPAPRVSLSRPEPGKPAGGLTPDDVASLRALVQKAGGIEELIRWLELLRGFQG